LVGGVEKKRSGKIPCSTGVESLLVAIAGRIGLFLKMVFYHKNFGPRAGMKVTSWYFWELTNLTTRRW